MSVKAKGLPVVAVGKIEDLFAGRGITRAIHTASDDEGMNVVERQMGEVTVNRISQIARHVFLERGAELSGDPHQQVLQQHRRQHDEDDVAQRVHLVAGNDLAADGGVEKLRDPARLERGRRLVEQDVEKRNQQRDGKAIEQRRHQVGANGDGHPPRVRAQVRQQPLVDGRLRW